MTTCLQFPTYSMVLNIDYVWCVSRRITVYLARFVVLPYTQKTTTCFGVVILLPPHLACTAAMICPCCAQVFCFCVCMCVPLGVCVCVCSVVLAVVEFQAHNMGKSIAGDILPPNEYYGNCV